MSVRAYFNNSLTETKKAERDHYGEWLRQELVKSVSQNIVVVPLTIKNVDDFLNWLKKEV